MADVGQVERFVVVSTCGEHRAIVQFRCLGLTGMDIHIYVYTYIFYTNGGRQRITITCLAFRLDNNKHSFVQVADLAQPLRGGTERFH